MKNYHYKGLLLGMEQMGAKHIKTDFDSVYFEIKKGSSIDDKGKLSRANQAFIGTLGLTIKVKRIETK
jgi:hypothetical protein